MNDKDICVLNSIHDYGFLNVKQLCMLHFTSAQMTRRWIRKAEQCGWIYRKSDSGFAKTGRPIDLIFISSKACLQLGYVKNEPRHIRHHALINEFRFALNNLDEDTYRISLKKANIRALSDSGYMIPDLVASIGKANRALLFFLESDCDTEPLTGNHVSSIEGKIHAYQDYWLNRGHAEYSQRFDYDFKGFRVLFIATNEQREMALIRLLETIPNTGFIWVTTQKHLADNHLTDPIWLHRETSQRQPIL